MKKRQLLLSLVLMLVFVFALTTGVAAKSKGKSKKVALNKTSASIAPGNTLKLKVKNSKEKATWKSSNTEIATVSRTGLVRAKKSGKATISAKVGKKTLKCKVTVKNVAKSVPLKGAKTVTYLTYIYKRVDPDKKEYTIKDYEFVPEEYKNKYEQGYNDYVDKCKKAKIDPPSIQYVGVATISLTDACIMYQNFDTTLNGYRGEHRYDIGLTGAYSMPDEISALLKTKEDWNWYVDGIGAQYRLWSTNAPYNKGYAWKSDYEPIYDILVDEVKLSNVVGDGQIVNSLTVDKQAKTFALNVTDLTQDEEATGGLIELTYSYDDWFGDFTPWWNYDPMRY